MKYATAFDISFTWNTFSESQKNEHPRMNIPRNKDEGRGPIQEAKMKRKKRGANLARFDRANLD